MDSVKCMADLLERGAQKADEVAIWVANNPEGRVPRDMSVGNLHWLKGRKAKLELSSATGSACGYPHN